MDDVTGREALRFSRAWSTLTDDARALRRAAEAGAMTRVRRGAYLPTSVWAALTDDERYRLEVAAALQLAEGRLVASHQSAAALWQAPVLERVAGTVEVLTTVGAGSRTEHGFRRHAVVDPARDVVRLYGLRCTSLERTVIDLSMTSSFGNAVAVADWALRTHTSVPALERQLHDSAPTRGSARAAAVLRFADGRSGSVGESLSRVAIADAELEAPDLQVAVRDEAGLIGLGDFAWLKWMVIGEFDGLVKYRDAGMLAGRTASEVVIAEKRREDRLRRAGFRVVRWTWADVQHPGRLADILLRAGVGRRAA